MEVDKTCDIALALSVMTTLRRKVEACLSKLKEIQEEAEHIIFEEDFRVAEIEAMACFTELQVWVQTFMRRYNGIKINNWKLLFLLSHLSVFAQQLPMKLSVRKKIISLYHDIRFPHAFGSVKTFKESLKKYKNIDVSYRQLLALLRSDLFYNLNVR